MKRTPIAALADLSKKADRMMVLRARTFPDYTTGEIRRPLLPIEAAELAGIIAAISRSGADEIPLSCGISIRPQAIR